MLRLQLTPQMQSLRLLRARSGHARRMAHHPRVRRRAARLLLQLPWRPYQLRRVLLARRLQLLRQQMQRR